MITNSIAEVEAKVARKLKMHYQRTQQRESIDRKTFQQSKKWDYQQRKL